MATAFADTWRADRAKLTVAHQARPPRTPILVVLAHWAARVIPTINANQVRRVVLSVAGFAGITVAAWMIAVPLGLLVGGVCLLILEALSSSDGP